MSNRLFAGLPDGLPDDEPEVQQSQLPPELEGKSAAELYEVLKEENARLLQEQEQQFKAQAYDSSKEQKPAQGSGQQRQSQVTPPPYQPQYGGQKMQQEPEVDFYSNPEGFMERQLEKRMGPVIQSTYNSLKETNKAQFQQQVGQEEWEKYGEEISDFVNGLTPQVQVDPRAFKTAYNYIRSLHLDEITESKAEKLAEQKVRERLEAMGYDPDLAEGTEGTVKERMQQALADEVPEKKRSSSLFQRDTGTVPSGVGRQSGPAQQAKGSRLSPEQRQMAERFGMTEKEYADYAKFNTDMFSEMEA